MPKKNIKVRSKKDTRKQPRKLTQKELKEASKVNQQMSKLMFS